MKRDVKAIVKEMTLEERDWEKNVRQKTCL